MPVQASSSFPCAVVSGRGGHLGQSSAIGATAELGLGQLPATYHTILRTPRLFFSSVPPAFSAADPAPPSTTPPGDEWHAQLSASIGASVAAASGVASRTLHRICRGSWTWTARPPRNQETKKAPNSQTDGVGHSTLRIIIDPGREPGISCFLFFSFFVRSRFLSLFLGTTSFIAFLPLPV